MPQQRLHGADRFVHHRIQRIEDRHAHSPRRRHREKLGVHQIPPRQAVGNIAETHRYRQAQFRAIQSERFQHVGRRRGIRRQRRRQRVQQQILAPETQRRRRVDNPFHRIHPFPRIGRQSARGQRQAQHGRAVLFGDRQKFFQPLRFGGHRVHQRPARINPQPRFQRFRVGRVDRQRQRHQLGQFLHQPRHQRGLVDARHAGVHVEDRRSRFLLRQRIVFDCRQVAFTQLRRHRLASGRIDPLADDPDREPGPEINRTGPAGQAMRLAQRRLDRHRLQPPQGVPHRRDMRRRRPAAAADRRDSGVHDPGNPGRVLLRAERENRPPVLQHRHAGIRPQSHRQGRRRHHLFDERQQLVRPQ